MTYALNIKNNIDHLVLPESHNKGTQLLASLIRLPAKMSGCCRSLNKKFKAFVEKRGGNVVDLGVGIIIGAAFSAVVNSFVVDILTPPLGLVIHDSQLENFFIIIRPGKTHGAHYTTPHDAQADGAVTMNIGSFITACITFFLICITLFWIVLVHDSVQEQVERNKGKSPATLPCPWCKADVPKEAAKCQHCCSMLNEKPPQATGNNESLIDVH
ncbi:6204_t:CDS:2 [Paraglomus brasilianum]|uniref:6204_t:CDS:1 n=1 Tax=Paraglomus brasilianum TaxID=144538 RepID=A0A9N8WPT2_9GLOM|nr:6204_t:CDS:2 [Paraglomus brasilianum]